VELTENAPLFSAAHSGVLHKDMKRLVPILAMVALAGCAAGKPQRPESTSSPTSVLALLRRDLAEAKVTVQNRKLDLVIQWMPRSYAITCSRPLDLYLEDNQIGAFVTPIQNLTLEGPSLHDAADALRPEVESYLKKHSIPERTVRSGKNIGNYMETDAEQDAAHIVQKPRAVPENGER
jgi:hypothetical protein